VNLRDGAPITTPRLLLRPFRATDADAFLAYQDHPDVRRHLPGPAMDADAARRHVAAQAAMSGAERDAWHGWVLEHREEGRVVGDVGVWVPAGDPPRGDVGFQLAPTHHRQGLATEAVAALCRHLLGVAGLERLTAGCDAGNTGSQAVLRAVGMVELPAAPAGQRAFELVSRGAAGGAAG
jgi:RimJ/RimL family protein N-acetyltransferase